MARAGLTDEQRAQIPESGQAQAGWAPGMSRIYPAPTFICAG